MKYQLIGIDLDGTLLNSAGQLSETNLQALHRARDAGVEVVLCTGRGLAETHHVTESLAWGGPIVLACGALITDTQTGKTLHRHPLGAELAHELVHHFDHDEHSVLVLPDPEAADHDYLVVAAHNMTDNTRWWFDQIDARIVYEDSPDHQDLLHALRIAVVGTPDQMAAEHAAIEQNFGAKIASQHFAAIKQHNEVLHLLEIFSEGVNKWTGLQWMAEHFGIDPAHTAAIGDQINDTAMLNGAACGIAVANAEPTVLAAADQVTTTNDEDGVALAIDRLLAGLW